MELDDDSRRYFRAQIRTMVVGALAPLDQIITTIGDIARYDTDASYDEVQPWLMSQMEHFIAECAVAERAWKDTTTNDRLDEVFVALNDAGLVALQAAGFTMSDAWADANYVARCRGGARGAVFYHGQDLERAVDGGGLMLGYGAYEDGDDRLVAEHVLETLNDHGIEASWNGKVETRIEVLPFEWQRRRWLAYSKNTPVAEIEEGLRRIVDESVDGGFVIAESSPFYTQVSYRPTLQGARFEAVSNEFLKAPHELDEAQHDALRMRGLENEDSVNWATSVSVATAQRRRAIAETMVDLLENVYGAAKDELDVKVVVE